MQNQLLGALWVVLAVNDPGYQIGLIIGRVIGMLIFVFSMCYVVHIINPWNAKPKGERNTTRSKRPATGELDDD